MGTEHIESLIGDLALILILGAIATILFKKLKQPVVLGYIVAGFIASPHFAFFPSVVDEANIEFWAQIGIIVLLFSLGLEFSFQKLLNVGGSAAVTALIIVLGMMGTGYVVGHLMGFGAIDSLFLGGMLSMSSTTIILKALTDLNMRQRRFVPQVMAVLVVEDMFAVVLMVILSSIAINKTVESDKIVESILQLSFFLVIWFTVGVFLIPSIFRKYNRIISDEMMLIIAMGLCFSMAIFSVKSGFSMALGAFIMGSILAGTSQAERIEKIITPVKDLFGAVFFISVGMMVNPTIIAENAGIIFILAAVVVVGMIVFGSLGMLATGQPLKIALESGFSLTQIGEFSFIIASLGMSLGVLQDNIYPIIVAVSVITIFFTPFFIKQAIPFYNWLAPHLPKKWIENLDGYSKQAAESEVSEVRRIWKAVIQNYLLRLLLYSTIIIGLTVLSRTYFVPWLIDCFGKSTGKLVGTIVTLSTLLPFMYGIMSPGTSLSDRLRIIEISGRINYVPFAIMVIVSIIICMGYVMGFMYGLYSSTTSLITAVLFTLGVTLLLAPLLHKRINRIETRFINNINERENRRTGRNNTLVSDLHMAYMTVGYGCPFVGEQLKNADLRKRYGVNVAYIQRNGVTHAVPTGEMRIFPGDVLGVVGTDEQIQQMLPLVEQSGVIGDGTSDVSFAHITLLESSPLIGYRLSEARLREDYTSMLVSVQRGDNHIPPTPGLTFMTGDVLWIVGSASRMSQLRGEEKQA